jgi:hypothetical protein
VDKSETGGNRDPATHLLVSRLSRAPQFVLQGWLNSRQQALAETCLKHSWQLYLSLGAHKLAPNGEPNQTLLAAQASPRLVTS